jgi:hypothetical protein
LSFAFSSAASIRSFRMGYLYRLQINLEMFGYGSNERISEFVRG